MKKKILLSLLSVLLLVVLVGCDNTSINEEESNETKKDNSHLCYEKLCFSLPNKYDVKENNVFVINDKIETIKVEISYKENVENELNDYIKSDSKNVDLETISNVIVNEKEWTKAKGEGGKYLYYIKENNNVYTIEIDPVIDSEVRAKETMEMLEKTLSFEK